MLNSLTQSQLLDKTLTKRLSGVHPSTHPADHAGFGKVGLIMVPTIDRVNIPVACHKLPDRKAKS